MPHAVGMLLGGIRKFLFNVIIGPTTVGTSNSNLANAIAASAHLFTMSDGNLVALYYDGTNYVYRIKASGTWGAATTVLANASFGSWTRNGDILYGAIAGTGVPGTNLLAFKAVYSGGTITLTSTTISTSNGSICFGAYYDAPNGYIHFVFYDSSLAVLRVIGQSATTIATNTIAATTLAPAQGANTPTPNTVDSVCAVAGDGTSTFLVVVASSFTSCACQKIVAGASAYTLTAEGGAPTTTNSGRIGLLWDGSNYIVLYIDSGGLVKTLTRTGANTWGTWTTLVASGAASATDMAPAGFVRSTGAAPRDIVVYYQRTLAQANGEIYYLRRLSGTWDASPGTRLAGGTANGWSEPSAAANDVGKTGTSRVLYLTGTAAPFNIIEDGLQ